MRLQLIYTEPTDQSAVHFPIFSSKRHELSDCFGKDKTQDIEINTVFYLLPDSGTKPALKNHRITGHFRKNHEVVLSAGSVRPLLLYINHSKTETDFDREIIVSA